MVRCGLVWAGVVWCGAARCGVGWCGVVWCGTEVPNHIRRSATIVPKGIAPDEFCPQMKKFSTWSQTDRDQKGALVT